MKVQMKWLVVCNCIYMNNNLDKGQKKKLNDMHFIFVWAFQSVLNHG